VLALPVGKAAPKKPLVYEVESLARLKSAPNLLLRHVLYVVRDKERLNRRIRRLEGRRHSLALTGHGNHQDPPENGKDAHSLVIARFSDLSTR